jgi:disulfide bond formation protein DsbB
MALSQKRVRDLLAWVVIVLILVPGVAAWLGMVEGESPCILCWAQRTSMVLIALVGLFILRYGPRLKYIGVAVLLGGFGVFMALRHSALHLARDVGQGFAASYFGVHTYAWSWFIHWTVLLTIGVLVLLLRETSAEGWGTELNRPGRFALGLFLVVVGANAFQAFVSTGPPPFIGQGDPVRFSLNPRHWVWSLEETAGRISWRGSWTIHSPDPTAADADPDPAHGPLQGLPSLAVSGWDRVGVSLDGALTDLARDPATGQFLAVTDRYDVYLLDSALSRVLHHVRLDPGFSVDLSPLAGAAFVGDTLVVLSTNKSYALLRPDSAADAGAEWRHFLATDGGVSELRLGRFATVRARQMYVLSLAYDPAAQELITVTIPSPRQRRLVVSRFSRADFLPASEFAPHLAPALEVSGTDSSLAGYRVTGATVADGTLYAISAAYSTLLVVDLKDRAVRAAYAVPGLTHPVGLAARGSQLLVAQADGRIAVLEPLSH